MHSPQLAENLRRAVLQAAIAGKLNERQPENARDLLLQIQAEKDKRIKQGSLKKTKSPAPIGDDEIPFEIPENWVWVRFGELFEISSSRRVHQQDWKTSGIPFYRAREIARLADYGEVQNELFISDDLYSKLTALSEPPTADDFMVSGVGTLGKTYIVRETDKFYYKDASVLHVRNRHKITPHFFKYYMESEALMNQVRSNSSGTTVATLTIERFNNYLFPLPPLTEQQQIVAKLTDLLAEIDELRAAETALSSVQNAFPQKLRASLLAAAIEGKLNERQPENARDLLAQIQAEKAQRIKQGSLKKNQAPAPISADEIPFEIPENWVWVRLGNVVQVNPRNKAEDETEAGFMPMTLLNDGFQNSFTFETRPWQEIKKGFTHFSDGDVVIAKITPCFQNRKSAVINGLPNKIGAGTTELHVLRPYGATVLPEYLLFIAKSAAFINDGMANFTGTAGQQRVSSDFVKNYPISLPPLSEQQQIVAKLEALLAEIDLLENGK